jgi:hypothetical protein
MRKHPVLCLVALVSLALAACALGPWMYYVGLGIQRGEHFYHGLPSTYWKKSVGEYLEPWQAQPPSFPVRLLRRLHPQSGPASTSILNPDPAAVPVLIDLLQDAHGGVRGLACITLGEIGPPASPAIPAIIEAVKSEGAFPSGGQLLSAAPGALAQIGPDAVGPVTRLLEDENRYRRQWAATVLYVMGPTAEPAVPVLIRALGDSDPWVRQQVIHALGQMGPRAIAAIPSLRAFRATRAQYTRDNEFEMATEALKTIDAEAAREPQSR